MHSHPTCPSAPNSHHNCQRYKCLLSRTPEYMSHRRFIPLESLEEQYAGNRKRRRLMYALRRHHTPGSYRGRFDALTNEAFIFFQLIFDRCTPRRMRSHPPWFTCCYLAVRVFWWKVGSCAHVCSAAVADLKSGEAHLLVCI